MANKGMDIMLKIKAKIDKTLPKQMEALTSRVEKMKKANEDLKNAQKELSKASSIHTDFKISKEKYSASLLQLRKVRTEMKRLEKAKASGVKLSKAEMKSLKELTSQHKKLSDTVSKQRTSFQRYRMELKKLSKSLDEYKRDVFQAEIRTRAFAAQQKLIKGLKNTAGKVVGKIATGIKYGAVAAGTAAGYTSIASAKSYLEFEQNMKKVQAISGATAKEYQALEKEAIRLGATTKFTAGESAAAMEKMALAGFKTNQIIAAMGGVLDLAAASGEDVAMVSDIITDNLLPFKMAAEDTKRFADVLAWGMSKTNVTVEMLGESFKYASGSAGNLGVNLEEMVGTLGLMGDQAIKSGMAGRGMDSIFSELIKKKDILSRSEIGINIDNGKGEFIGLVKTVEQFENFLKGKTDIERTAFLQNVFGDQGSRAFTKLLMAEKEINGITYKGAEAVAKTVEAARKDSVGMSEKMRDIMLEGASGTWTLFTSAVDGFRVTLGKLLLNEKVLSYIRKVTNYISELTNVMSGVFNNSYYNVFWQKVFISTKDFISKFKAALQPGIEVIKRLFPADEMVDKIDRLFTILSNGAIFVASIFSKLMQIAEPFIKFIQFIGVDTIVIFIGALMGIAKVVSIFAKLKAAFLFVKEIGGIISLFKMVATILGGPIVLGITAAITLIYFLYKHFDALKKVFTGAFEVFIGVIKAGITGVKELFSKISEYSGIFNVLIPVKAIFDGLKAFWDSWDSGLSVLENVKNGFKAFFSGLKDSIASAIEGFGKLIKKVNEFETVKKFKRFFGFGEEDSVDGSHKSGLSYVPYDNYIARLHRGERVLTSEENKEYGSLLNRFNSSGRGLNVSSKKSAFVFSPKLEITVTGTASTSDISSVLERKMLELEEKFVRMIQDREEAGNDYVRTSF